MSPERIPAVAPPHISRLQAIIARWISILTCGLVAGALFVVFGPAVAVACGPLVDLLSSGGDIATACIVLLFAGCLIAVACSKQHTGLISLRYCHAYPPLWIACLIAVCVLRAANTLRADLQPEDSAASPYDWHAATVLLSLIGSSLVYQIVVDWRSLSASRRPSIGEMTQSGSIEAPSFDELHAWLKDDQPILHPSHDRFAHDEIARRLAQRLVNYVRPQSMALIGPKGSGKSTIGRLVQHHLCPHASTLFVRVSLWPFDSPEAAVRGILRSLIQALGRHVDVLALRGLSDEYVDAVERTGSVAGALVRLSRTTSNPADIIARLSTVAAAAGLHLVLWVEDLERFSGADHSAGFEEDERAGERLGAVRALLHLLDECTSVSVIVCDTSLRTRFDLSKIARVIETPPSLKSSDAARVIRVLRQRCLGGYPKEVLDPTARQVREAFAEQDPEHEAFQWFASYRTAPKKIINALAHVLHTPRNLKSCLRITLEIWECCAGEIDFDSVLVASAIRVARPTLFSLLTEHIEPLREGLVNPLFKDDNEGKHAVVGYIEELLRPENVYTSAAIKHLLSFVFPAYPPGASSVERLHVDRPQALFVNRYANYWRRYLSQSCAGVPSTDQALLREIANWRNGAPSNLIECIVDNSRSAQVEQFVGQFMPDDLCRLLMETCNRLSTVSAADWDSQAHAPGVAGVWRMMQLRPTSNDKVYDTVSGILKFVIPVHIPLANDVVYFLGTQTAGIPRLVDDHQSKALHRELRDGVLATFGGVQYSEQFVKAMMGGSPWLIFWIMQSPMLGHGENLAHCKGWQMFARMLLSVATSNPAIGIPLVSSLVVRGQLKFRSPRGAATHVWDAKFEKDDARQLFDFEELIGILANAVVPKGLDDPMQAYCRTAIEFARNHSAISLLS